MDVKIKEQYLIAEKIENEFYLPYIELTDILFFDGRNARKKLKGKVKIIKIKKKQYISVASLTEIGYMIEDSEEFSLFIQNLFRIPKRKSLESIERLENAVDSLSDLKGVFYSLTKTLEGYEKKQQDLLHCLENTDKTSKNINKITEELITLRKKRRIIKERFKLTKIVYDELKKLNICSGDFQKILNKFIELKNELEISRENNIYFNRDGSNREEMQNKINEIQEKFKN